MKLDLTVNKTNIAKIESYLACIALEAITEDIEINTQFSCPTENGFIYEVHLSSLYDVETAMIKLRSYAKSIVRCRVYHDTLLTIIKAESTRKRAESFKALVTDAYKSDTMNLTEMSFYIKHFIVED